MGCYGIGVTRILGPRRSSRTTTTSGIIWPRRARALRGRDLPARLCDSRPTCAPPPTALTPNFKRPGIDVILDDRGERPGAMFADWELIGVPVRLTVV
jgi:prolyl-tRNA synthetase